MKRYIAILVLLVCAVAVFADTGNGLPSKYDGASVGRPIDVSPLIHFKGNCYLVIELSESAERDDIEAFLQDIDAGLTVVWDSDVTTSAMLASIMPPGAVAPIGNTGNESYKHWSNTTATVTIEKPKVAMRDGYWVPVSTNEKFSHVVCVTSDDDIQTKLENLKGLKIDSAANTDYSSLYQAYLCRFKGVDKSPVVKPRVEKEPKKDETEVKRADNEKKEPSEAEKARIARHEAERKKIKEGLAKANSSGGGSSGKHRVIVKQNPTVRRNTTGGSSDSSVYQTGIFQY